MEILMNEQKLKIGMYAGSWPQNIGNAFFDFGAEAIVRQAFPNAEIFRTGGAVHWMFNNSHRARFGLATRAYRKFRPNAQPINGNSLEIGELSELDILIFPGMSMCEEFAINNGPTFIEANKRGVAVLGLGAGSSLYTDRDVEKFSEFFSKLNHAAIITRDDDTFNLFRESISNIETGIDCAFFLPDYYSPPSMIENNYEVVTFDGKNPPKSLASPKPSRIFAHHDLWGPLPKRYTSTPRTLVSDVPEDYLTLYANCEVTYSDRVHACIASLAYGNRAQLFSNTPRKALFDKLDLEKITTQPVRLNKALVAELKATQIEKTRRILLGLVSRA
jgi:hypothetical protein